MRKPSEEEYFAMLRQANYNAKVRGLKEDIKAHEKELEKLKQELKAVEEKGVQ